MNGRGIMLHDSNYIIKPNISHDNPWWLSAQIRPYTLLPQWSNYWAEVSPLIK